MRMNKLTSMAVAVSMALSASVMPIAAATEAKPVLIATMTEAKNDIKITLDGNVIDCEKYGQNPVIVEGRTLVPLRSVFEAFGASVEWNNDDRSVTSVRGEDKIVLKVDSNEMTVNGQVKTIDVPAMIMNERTMVPVRAVAEAFGATVSWDNDARCVIIKNVAEALSPTQTVKKAYDAIWAFNYQEAGKYTVEGTEILDDLAQVNSVNDLIASVTTEAVSDEEAKMIEALLKDILALINCEITGEKIDGDVAEVYVKMTAPNIEKMNLEPYFTEEAIMYLYESVLANMGYTMEDVAIITDEAESAEIQNALVEATFAYMIEAIKQEIEEVGYTVTEDVENLVFVDGKWLIK